MPMRVVAKMLLLVREVIGSILGLVKSDTVCQRLGIAATFVRSSVGIARLTIRPGLAGTVPVLMPCPGVPTGWSKCPGYSE